MTRSRKHAFRMIICVLGISGSFLFSRYSVRPAHAFDLKQFWQEIQKKRESLSLPFPKQKKETTFYTPDKVIPITIEQLPQLCSEIGLITEEECSLCAEIPNAECRRSRRTNEGLQCYECTEKLQECNDVGLLNREECTLCAEIPDAECVR
ncbi:MAG: hypothetical protein WC450_05260, partial [Candidatus Omnitrophota bacterium]